MPAQQPPVAAPPPTWNGMGGTGYASVRLSVCVHIRQGVIVGAFISRNSSMVLPLGKQARAPPDPCQPGCPFLYGLQPLQQGVAVQRAKRAPAALQPEEAAPARCAVALGGVACLAAPTVCSACVGGGGGG